MRTFKKSVAVVIISIFLFFSIGGVRDGQSQEKYPARAISIICPVGAGGGNDLTTRVMAAYLNKKWGVPVNVLNKPGGNSIPGTLEVYEAKPDGYTILADSVNTSLLPAVSKNLPFKIMDRSYVCMHSAMPQVFFANSQSPFKSMKDLEAEANRDPGSFTWTSQGGTGGQDLAAMQFFKAIGLDASKTKPVMAQSGAQTVALVAGGHVKMGLGTSGPSMPAIKGGMVRALAITSPTRWPDLPEVPTTSELGYPNITVMSWFGFSGPPRLPPNVVEAWNKAILEISKDPEGIAKLKNIAAMPLYRSSNEMKDRAAKEIEEVSKLWGLR